MKNKKNIIIIEVLVVLLLTVVAIILLVNNKEEYSPGEYSIIYTYGGGFGTMASTATREITIQSDGNVTIDLKNHEFNIEPVSYVVEKEKVDEVMHYLIDNGFETMKEDLSDENILDGDSYYIEVKSADLNRKVGGYAPYNNKKFSNMKYEVYKLVDDKKLKEFNDRVTKAYEKQE